MRWQAGKGYHFEEGPYVEYIPTKEGRQWLGWDLSCCEFSPHFLERSVFFCFPRIDGYNLQIKQAEQNVIGPNQMQLEHGGGGFYVDRNFRLPVVRFGAHLCAMPTTRFLWIFVGGFQVSSNVETSSAMLACRGWMWRMPKPKLLWWMRSQKRWRSEVWWKKWGEKSKAKLAEKKKGNGESGVYGDLE